MLFKRTKHAQQNKSLMKLNLTVAILNAFTSKEQTCYYGRGLSENFKKTFVVLSDMIQNPSFKESHIKKEERCD